MSDPAAAHRPGAGTTAVGGRSDLHSRATILHVVTGKRSAGEVAQNIDLMRVEIPLEFRLALQRGNLLLDAAAIPQ